MRLLQSVPCGDWRTRVGGCMESYGTQLCCFHYSNTSSIVGSFHGSFAHRSLQIRDGCDLSDLRKSIRVVLCAKERVSTRQNLQHDHASGPDIDRHCLLLRTAPQNLRRLVATRPTLPRLATTHPSTLFGWLTFLRRFEHHAKIIALDLSWCQDPKMSLGQSF